MGHFSGYQNNPYLRADVDGVLLVGQVPDLRTRQTVSARLRQALPADTYLEADYRHYFDDWQVKSNTVAVGVSHHFGAEVLMNLGFRWYDQTGAYFWAPQYTGSPQYYTADFRLDTFTSNNYSGRVEFTPKRQWWWLPSGTGLTVQYERYQADNGFHASIVSTACACRSKSSTVRILSARPDPWPSRCCARRRRLLERRATRTGQPAAIDRVHGDPPAPDNADHSHDSYDSTTPTTPARDGGRACSRPAADLQYRLRALPRRPVGCRALFDDDLQRRDGGGVRRQRRARWLSSRSRAADVFVSERRQPARRTDPHVGPERRAAKSIVITL